MKKITILGLMLVLLLGACAAPTPESQAGPTQAEIELETYTNAEAGFSLQAPAAWGQGTLPDQNEGAIQGEGFSGTEGGVEVYWGVGFGGACPSGTEPVKLAVGEVPACHTTRSDGTEFWEQIGYEVEGGNSFSVRAYTGDAKPSSHDLVLQVLSTLTFMAPVQPPAEAEIANPASQNCVDQGGTLTFEARGDEGQFGVCTFEDNLQCEEWALMRGDCPVTGVKVTGYVTPAGRYCAITGGEYAVKGNSGAEDEQGTCTFKDGSQCDAWDYYNGKCTPQPAETAASPSAPSVDLNPYANAQVGFTIQMPSTWSQQTLPGQGDGAIQGEGFSGPEGGVEVYWGIGFGGACPAEPDPVQLAAGEAEACHIKKNDGTEEWNQIGYQVEGGNSFSVRAYTSDPQPASRDLVLQVLSTLILRTPAKLAIRPLTIEVCDGQAQAMAHALDVLEVTQSEEFLDDYINEAFGIGCQALATGTGAQFESPDAVVTALGSMLVEQGWTQDPNLAAGGPGISLGYRKGDQICWAGAVWKPDESANCPTDQPNSACDVAPEQQNYTVTLNCGVEAPAGGAASEDQAASPTHIELPGGGFGQLVFDSTRGGVGYRNLYQINSDGMNVFQLTQDEADNFAGPWSPEPWESQRILYTAYGPTNSSIAVMNADLSGQSILDQVDGSDEGFPDWSPDGKQIAFNSRRDGNNEIYLMNADGSNPVRLTNAPGDDFAPSWSPDGTQIVFVSDRDQEAGIYDLYIMYADGSGVKRLTNDPYLDYSPDWSPDGRMIIFRSHHDGAADIYLINVDGSGLTALTDDPAEDWAPAWSPDGTLIAFQTNRDGNWEIYLMTADGSQPVNLTNDPADDQLPYWRP